MSFLDRIAAAVTPAASDEERARARQDAETLGHTEEWVGLIVQQHKQIESLLDDAGSAGDPNQRRLALKEFARILTGHSNAEEVILYPDIAEYNGKTQAAMAYEEHAMTKIQVAKLEKLDPMTQDWTEKVEHIRGALQQHMYQEESSWLPDLVQNLPGDEKAHLSKRYVEEFNRYCGDESSKSSASSAMPLPGQMYTQA